MTKEELERGQKILEELKSIEFIIGDIKEKKFENRGFYRLSEELRVKWISETLEIILAQKEILEKEFLSI